MAEISSRQIEQLQEAFARPERLTEGAALAGGALALPLLAMRRRQAAMEVARTERRLGADHAETKARQAHAQSLALREGNVQKEVARLQLPRPVVDDQAGLYGRVTRKGEPVPGVAVAALDEAGASIAHSCTGHDGGYLLAFPPDQPVSIEVRDENRRLFRDETGVAYPPYRATHRDIELSRAKPVCPDDKPAEPGGRVQVPNLVGMKEEEALRVLDGLGLQPGKRGTRKGPEAGIVVEHDPAAGQSVAAGGAVALIVSTGEDKPARHVPDLTGKSLHQAVQEIKTAGAELGSVSVTSDGGRTPIVRTARPDDKGEKVDLDVSTSGGDAQVMRIVATVLAASPEGAELQLESTPAAMEWLRSHRLASLDDMSKAQALDDAALRRRMRLKPDAPVAPVRGLLNAGIGRVRKG